MSLRVQLQHPSYCYLDDDVTRAQFDDDAHTANQAHSKRVGIITVSKQKLTTHKTETSFAMPLLTKPRLNLTQDRAQTEPRAPYKNPNRPQNTKLKLVDVTRNTLTMTSIQPLPQSQHGRRRLKGIGAFFF
ncbi:MAG TPA: hypothetical protein VJ249_09850 [Candidatus Bathyarchaeia archaeon]|nr:hypothetical protein [Candidatus Bathyarchaeia archaeon]